MSIEYKKETILFTKQEIDDKNNQIKKLEPTIVVLTNSIFEIKHELTLIMIDGKVCNALTENTSAQVCYICKATSKDMNNIFHIKKGL